MACQRVAGNLGIEPSRPVGRSPPPLHPYGLPSPLTLAFLGTRARRGENPPQGAGRRGSVLSPAAEPGGQVIRSMLSLAVLAAAPPPAVAIDPPTNGVELIAQMRQRYLGKWYRTLT